MNSIRIKVMLPVTSGGGSGYSLSRISDIISLLEDCVTKGDSPLCSSRIDGSTNSTVQAICTSLWHFLWTRSLH